MTKQKLLAYRIQGSAAARMFEQFEDAAENSDVERPNEGLGAIISWEADQAKELLEALKATKQLIKDNDVNELLLFKDNLDEAGKTFIGIAFALADFVNMLEESDED